MSEKNMPFRSKFITISMLFLILFSLFLLLSSYTSLIPRSVFRLILDNTTQVHINPNSQNDQIKKFPFLSFGSPKIDPGNHLRTREFLSQFSNSTKNVSSPGKQTKLPCDPNQALLRVFMYDLPPEFHFGLLGWKGKENETWLDLNNPTRIPQYPGGLNLQHSIEYWLTLDLLSSNIPTLSQTCTVIRVDNSSQADVIFVPFFSSLSYNRYSKVHGKEEVSVNKLLQEKLVKFLLGREEWKRSGGKNHVIVAHHPNSMLEARKKLGSAMFVLADFGRYSAQVANIEKDIIAPYKHVVRTVPSDKSSPFEERPILAYFQGAIYRKDGGAIRQELYYLLKDEKDVHFSFGSVGGNGIKKASQGMASSKFCLNIAGDTPSSNRLFDSIASHCIPVIISDSIELPFEDVLDYSQFCLFVRGSDAVKKGYIMNLLRGIERERWTKMWERLKEIEHHFEYQFPSKSEDAVNMIWEAISRKVSNVRFKLRRRNRYHRSQQLLKKQLK